MVLFVGHSPSKASCTPKLPFVGTRSGNTLTGWSQIMGCENYHLANAASVPGAKPTEKDLNLLKQQVVSYRKVIALGEQASAALTKIGKPHFKLPHPSGLNRKLNDKAFVSGILKECTDWIVK